MNASNSNLNPQFPWSSLPTFTLTSETLVQGGTLPAPLLSAIFGVEAGRDLSPELRWSDFPENTRSFALTAYDPDAPTGSGFWHWAVYNIPASVTQLPFGAGTPANEAITPPAITLKNDAGIPGYLGAAPPAGHGPHRYVFTVFAVDTPALELPAEASPALLGFTLFTHTLAYAQLVGVYANIS